MISEIKVSSRNLAFDLMKGMAVLAMIQVHLTELFARQDIYDSFSGQLSLFFGGVPAAPVFMAVMGYFLATSTSLLDSLTRGIKLIVWGLLLNIGLNFHLIYKTWQGNLHTNLLQYVFGADILLLAGFSVIIISIVRLIFRNAWLPYLLLALAIAAFGPYIPVVSGSKLPYLMAFAGGNYSWSYFPVFPWLAYPLAGLAFGLGKDKIRALTTGKDLIIFALCFVLWLTGLLVFGFRISSSLTLYYHHGILFFVWALLFIICIAYIAAFIVSKSGTFVLVRYFAWLGKNVTAIYVIQWLIIGNIATQIWKTQGFSQLALWYAGILTAVSVLAYIYTSIKAYFTPSKEISL